MNFTAEQIAAMTLLVTAFGTVATIVGGLVVKIITLRIEANTKVTQEAAVVSVENGKKADVIIEKAVQIHELTNSNLSKVTADLDIALTKIEGLQKLVASLVEAKSVADRLAAATNLPSAPTSDAGSTLKQIEANTDATAKNTARPADDA